MEHMKTTLAGILVVICGAVILFGTKLEVPAEMMEMAKGIILAAGGMAFYFAADKDKTGA